MSKPSTIDVCNSPKYPNQSNSTLLMEYTYIETASASPVRKAPGKFERKKREESHDYDAKPCELCRLF